ncbi:MAG: SCP2 sterol-binding domain-containing protein [Gammaproteobacteria bacterium]|nr:SCP2 sterol-binding domain-containing protein [Gammaproteobacteria bacterium]
MHSKSTASLLYTPFFSVLTKLPLAHALLQTLINRTLLKIQRHHPGIAERLSEFHGKTLLIEFSDLPFYLLLPIEQSLKVRIIPNRSEALASEPFATVRSELYSLWQLFQGKLDGDALFFSRDLSIDGNTELIVALRNALDGVKIDWVKDVFNPPQILIPLFKKTFNFGKFVSLQLSGDLKRIQNTVLSPVHKELDKLSHSTDQLAERMTALEKQTKRGVRS